MRAVKQHKFAILGDRRGTRLAPDQDRLLEVVERRLPKCNPAYQVETIDTARLSARERPVRRTDDMALDGVDIECLTLEVADDMDLATALHAANDALSNIGRPDLRAELREL